MNPETDGRRARRAPRRRVPCGGLLPSYTRSRATTGVNASVGARMELALARGAFADRQLQDRVHVAPRALADPSTEHRTVSDPNWELEFRQGLDSEAAEARSAHASETHLYQGFPASGINEPGTSPTAPVRAATNRAMRSLQVFSL